MDILIIANFVSSLDNDANSRYTYLADLLSKNNSVELVSSDFSHTNKRPRSVPHNKSAYKVTLIHEPGYKKNISIQRFISHLVWGNNVKKYLNKRVIPDVIYCAVPSLTAAFNVSTYCKKNKVRFIIDIQDLWPEAFQVVFHIPFLSNVIFMPFNVMANKIYRSADQVIAVSHTYADRAMRVNKKCKRPVVVYLGTDKEYFDQCANHKEENRKLNNILMGNGITRIAYVGTLGRSYNIALILQAIRELPREVQSRIQFVVMGDGPDQQQLERQAKGLPVIFTGRLSYPDMVWLLTRCDIAVNPIVKGAAQSITNKQMDYAMAGLPVINTQESKEYRHLINHFDCGINCECGNIDDVKKAMIELIEHPELRKNMGINSRKMGEKLFDRAKTYPLIKKLI